MRYPQAGYNLSSPGLRQWVTQHPHRVTSSHTHSHILTYCFSFACISTHFYTPSQNHTHVVSPIIDIINKDSMQYTSASPIVKGGQTLPSPPSLSPSLLSPSLSPILTLSIALGFGHNLHFRWDQMSGHEIRSRAKMIDPIRCV